MSAILSAIRRGWSLNTVSGRLTFWYLCTLAASLAVFALFVLVMRARALEQQLLSTLDLRTYAAVETVEQALRSPDPVATLRSHPEVTAMPVVIRHEDGSVLFRSAAFPSFAPDADRELSYTIRARAPLMRIRDASGDDVYVAFRMVRAPDGALFTIQLVASTAEMNAAIRDLALVQLAGILLVLAIARYGSAFTARRALAPIDEIVRRVKDIQASRPAERLQVGADTEEIRRLVTTLNAMLDRLEGPVHTARRFAADVSHELQTPISAIRFALEACARGNRPLAWHVAIANDLITELDRLSAIIRDLRLLALAGSQKLFTQPEPVDLGMVTIQCCEIARALAEEKNITVEQAIQPGLVVLGSALHLRRAILNVAQNAVRYSPRGSTVEISVAQRDATAIVSVRDHGCGIDAADLPRIFEAFYRTDSARTRETGGSGLGLAVAQQVVAAHGGRIEVVSALDQGSTFTLHLPAASGTGTLS